VGDTIREMHHRHNLQSSALPVVVLSGHAVVRAAHAVPCHLLYDTSLAQIVGAATRVVTKASWRLLMLTIRHGCLFMRRELYLVFACDTYMPQYPVMSDLIASNRENLQFTSIHLHMVHVRINISIFRIFLL
jgi:hypothetical protein